MTEGHLWSSTSLICLLGDDLDSVGWWTENSFGLAGLDCLNIEL